MVEDEKLIREVLKGNNHAFQQLVERYQNYVFTITYKVLRSREEAEEAAQDVFLKVYRMLSSFSQKSKFSTWLYTIAYRTAIDMKRRKSVDTRSIDDDESFFQLSDDGTTPLDALQQQDLQNQLKTAIDQLKPVDATVISLFYIHENSINEIAEITGLSISNIKTKLHRLRESLRQLLSLQLKAELKNLR